MKTMVVLSSCALAILLTACATPRQVSTYEGRGDRRVYPAPFDQVWRAAVDAAQAGELEVAKADRGSGYIAARRSLQVETFGENVGIWVTRVTPNETAVEVVSRQAGPPVLWLKNWENEIHRALAANLTRDVTGVGAAPRETVIVPGADSSTRELLREQERTLETLKAGQEAGQRALTAEVDETKREELQREIDRLRDELRTQEQRLRDLEREVK